MAPRHDRVRLALEYRTFIRADDLRMRIQYILQQRRAGPGMTAEQSEPVWWLQVALAGLAPAGHGGGREAGLDFSHCGLLLPQRSRGRFRRPPPQRLGVQQSGHRLVKTLLL